MDLGLKGKVAVVTGAAAGIGAAIAEALAQEGCKVWIADRDLARAKQTAAGFGSALSARAVEVDVSRPADVARTFRAVLDAEGSLDVLVCNAGVLGTSPFIDSTPEDWERLAAVNVAGVLNCIREAAPSMLQRGRGRIVNVASVSAAKGGGSVGNVLYGASKASVVALTMGLAREFGPSGVTVNAIAPALAETDMTRSSMSDDVRARVIARIPLRRMATPADIADAVVFLASDRASFITGAVLPVDGGFLTT